MNINKCKFHVQKIFFLRLLLFIEELKMNLRKVQRISEFTWSQSNKTSDFKQWHLIRSSIIFQNDFLQLILLSFKINSFRREMTLIITVVDDEACIKHSLINLFSKFSASLLMFLFDSEYSYMWTHVIEILHRTLHQHFNEELE